MTGRHAPVTDLDEASVCGGSEPGPFLGEWVTIRLARSGLLGQVSDVVHGITGRLPGLGMADGNVGFSPPRDAADAWEMRRLWCEAAGFVADLLATVGQVHGAEVMRVGSSDSGRGARPGSGRVGLGDALITDQPGVVLMTLHADCLPVLLIDPDRPAVAAVHAGWRGTVADVVGVTVSAMERAFGSQPEHLLAFVGPGIGPCCYEVGSEVTDAWIARGTGIEADPRTAIRARAGRQTFDLKMANSLLLRNAGLAAQHIDVHSDCTRCRGDRWFSHRGQGASTGRFGAMIAIQASGSQGETS